MKGIYENTVIENFLFCVGRELGESAALPPLSVNVIQQTPADPCLGDVLMGNERGAMLIEFKKSANIKGKDKEISKMKSILQSI